MEQAEASSSSSVHLAVSGTVEVRLRANDTVGDEVGVRPVISLGTLAIDKSSGVRDSSPETATADVLAPGITLGVEDQLAVGDGEAVVVHGLEGPLANEVGELGRLGDEGGLTANSGSDILRVGTSSGEVVNVRVDDKVQAGVLKAKV